jgi:dihydrofolate reductase
MGELVVTEFVTLDGVAQAPGGPEEDSEGAFAHGGWQGPLVDEQSGAVMFDQAQSMDALLLGRKTYDIFAAYWPNAPEEIPFTALLNRVPKYVASRSSTDPLAWAGSSVLAGDLAGAVTAVKERHDRVHVIGSLDLVQTLLHAGLVDRLDLWVYPLLLGSGKRVFAGGTVPAALRLAEATTYPTGAVHLTYEVDGVPTYADMAEQAAAPARQGEPG